ncbi:MAG: metallopeptidase family protein [Longimicrobiales bacterium]
MKFDRFESVAEAAFEAIPPEYRAGIDGLVVSREAMPHPELPDIWTLGMCDTESYPSDWVGPETTRSVVILYWGSFRNLARKSPDFDWEAEIHETVEHEVRHHLEWLAGHDDLGDVDYAMDESFKRSDGLPWDPWFFQKGDRIEPGVYAVEDQVFVEVELTPADFETAATVEFAWRGSRWAIPRPPEQGDLHFVWVEGVDEAPPALEVVLVRRLRWWEEAKRLFGASRPRVLESEAEARRVDPAPGDS